MTTPPPVQRSNGVQVACWPASSRAWTLLSHSVGGARRGTRAVSHSRTNRVASRKLSPVIQSWEVRHFSQSTPAGEGQADVPSLLRRVAASVEELQPVEIQDIVFHSETDDRGADWPSMTVYFHRADSP